MKHTLTTAQRPRSVTIILWGVFLFGVWNVGRALALYQQMDLLLELALRPDPRLRLIMALVWGLAFFSLWWLLRQKRPFSRTLIPIILSLYSLYELGLSAFFGQSRLSPQTIWLNAAFYLLLVGWTTWALNRKTAVCHYFNLSEED